ncbi:MAG: hypothetical protein K2L28_03260, partial [Muribaculaceae bacterium]|nr:hypothetical protein [Muribaculaceae bacterium]
FFPEGASFGQLLAVYPVSWTLTDIIMFFAFARIKTKLGMKGASPETSQKNSPKFCEAENYA